MNTDLFGHRSLADTGQRSAFDWYPTPAWATRSLLHYAPEISESLVLECASGDNAIVNVLHEYGCEVITNDIDLTHPSKWHYDATQPELWAETPVADWVITNPPFNAAFEMLKHAVPYACVGVAFLLRKTFEEPTQERGEFLNAHPPTRKICLPRHSFRGDGSDTVSCDWFIWESYPSRMTNPIIVDYLAKER